MRTNTAVKQEEEENMDKIRKIDEKQEVVDNHRANEVKLGETAVKKKIDVEECSKSKIKVPQKGCN